MLLVLKLNRFYGNIERFEYTFIHLNIMISRLLDIREQETQLVFEIS